MGLHDVAERFWSMLSRVGELDPAKCWPWPGKLGLNGYGTLRRRYKRVYAHRVAYELVKGPIPDGLVIDHTCRNRACCNPAHLEAVTVRENSLRGAGFTAQLHNMGMCARGHQVSGKNVYMVKNSRGVRRPKCRICKLMMNKDYRDRGAARRSALLDDRKPDGGDAAQASNHP